MYGFFSDIVGTEESLGLHLACNQYQHVYGESGEEGLVQKFRAEQAKNEPHMRRNIQQLGLISCMLEMGHKWWDEVADVDCDNG